jgi:hypothetical protein
MKTLEWRSGGRGKQVLVHLKMRAGRLSFANRFGEWFDAEEFLLGPNQYTWKQRYFRKLTRLLQQMSLRNPALFAEMCKRWKGPHPLCSLADKGVQCAYHDRPSPADDNQPPPTEGNALSPSDVNHYTIDGIEFTVSDVAPSFTTVEYNVIKTIL